MKKICTMVICAVLAAVLLVSCGGTESETLAGEKAKLDSKTNTSTVILSPEKLATLKKLKYSDEDINTIIYICETEEDQNLVMQISDGDNGYEGIFAIDPNKLSEDIKRFFVDYTARLLESYTDKFIELNNELLEAEMPYSNSDLSIFSQHYRYRDEWLDMLSEYSLSLLSLTPRSEREGILRAADIWNTEKVFIGMLPTDVGCEKSIFGAYGFRVEDINFEVSPTLKISFDWVIGRERCVCTLTMDENLSPGSLKTMMDYLSLKGVKFDVAMSATEISEGINAAMAEMSGTELKVFGYWFGMGTFFSISVDEGSTFLIDVLGITRDDERYIAFMGCYDAKMMENIADWQENGMDWYWIDEKDKEWFLNELNNRDDLDEVCSSYGCETEDVINLIKGGYNFNKDFDVKTFSGAINALNDMLLLIYGGNASSMWGSWVTYTVKQ